jgi:hypothetical protein
VAGVLETQREGEEVKPFLLLCGTLLVGACLAPAATIRATDLSTTSEFKLRPEWSGPCRYADVIDVNLGNLPEAFIRAAYGQVTGREPSPERVATWAARLRTDTHLRRIDVVRTFCKESGRSCNLRYSNPWLNNPDLAASGVKKTQRDVGAVVMFFFHCPAGVNCGMDWANTHAYGMDEPSPILAWGTETSGVYDAKNPGLWRRELRDAKFAGLDFILPNKLLKGPERLQQVLRDSADADILMIGTWNDLGEGTGINRNYDYYYLGRWLPPDYFMRLIRQSQCR